MGQGRPPLPGARPGGTGADRPARGREWHADAGMGDQERLPAGTVMTGDPGGPSFDLVAAALRADSADVAVYARVLTESLGDALPAGCVGVERVRSVSDRLHGRPG